MRLKIKTGRFRAKKSLGAAFFVPARRTTVVLRGVAGPSGRACSQKSWPGARWREKICHWQ